MRSARIRSVVELPGVNPNRSGLSNSCKCDQICINIRWASTLPGTLSSVMPRYLVAFSFPNRNNQSLFPGKEWYQTVTRQTAQHATHGSWHSPSFSASQHWYYRSHLPSLNGSSSLWKSVISVWVLSQFGSTILLYTLKRLPCGNFISILLTFFYALLSSFESFTLRYSTILQDPSAC